MSAAYNKILNMARRKGTGLFAGAPNFRTDRTQIKPDRPSADATPTPKTAPTPYRAQPSASIQLVPNIPIPATPQVAFKPVSFGDVEQLGQRYRARESVTIDLRATETDLKRRVVDFSAGLAFGLGGHLTKLAANMFLLTPDTDPSTPTTPKDTGDHDHKVTPVPPNEKSDTTL